MSALPVPIIVLICLFSTTKVNGQNEFGEVVFQDALRWNYTYVNPTCTSAGGARNPCTDIRICTFAAASLAIGGWPTLCGWVGKGVPKVCCGLPLVLGKGLMKKVNEELSRKKECGTRMYPAETEITKKLFQIKNYLPEMDISDPNRFDPPLDLDIKPMLIPPSVNTGSQQGSFSWMVSIRQNGSHLCGGSLIDRKHILTAASCVPDNENHYTVHVGNLYVDDGYKVLISKISIHPQYEELKNLRNLAILTLSEEILSPNVDHICLMGPNFIGANMEGTNTTLLQWSKKVEYGESRQYLNVINGLIIAPIEKCKISYEVCGNEVMPEVGEDFICAEASEDSDVEFEVDIGGPLMFKNKFAQKPPPPWTLIAVDTFGTTCENMKFSRLFTRISTHINWIEGIMNE